MPILDLVVRVSIGDNAFAYLQCDAAIVATAADARLEPRRRHIRGVPVEAQHVLIFIPVKAGLSGSGTSSDGAAKENGCIAGLQASEAALDLSFVRRSAAAGIARSRAYRLLIAGAS